jgi:tRNA (guanine37-N1)-methyltransferase
LVDSIARQIPGVLGKTESLEENRLGVGVPVYTRPEIYKFKGKKYQVPKVLLSGDHKKINEWRKDKLKK